MIGIHDYSAKYKEKLKIICSKRNQTLKNMKCFYCNRQVFTDKQPYANIDHVIPKKDGGVDRLDNLEISCFSCNNMKSHFSQKEFEIELLSLANAVSEGKKKMENYERDAYMHGAKMAAEYLREIGKTDLAQMTPQEALTFAECMCKNYHYFRISNDKNYFD